MEEDEVPSSMIGPTSLPLIKRDFFRAFWATIIMTLEQPESTWRHLHNAIILSMFGTKTDED